MENLNLFYQDIGPSSSAGRHLTQEEAEKEALAIRISQKFALLEEERHVIETMAYHDKYKKILDEIWKDKVELDGKTVKEDEEAVKRIKGEALKEKDDPGAFIFPIILEGKVNENALADTGTAESDSDDEEEYVIKRNKFGAPIYGPKPAPYLNYTNPKDRSSAIQTTPGTHDGEAGSSRSKRPRQHETVEELLLPQVHHEFLLWEGFSREAKSRYNTKLAQLLPRHIYSPCVVNWDVLNQMGYDGEIDDMLRIRLREAGSDEEIFTSFDEVCADDELQSKKIIKFRLGERAHNLTLLEFARRLGLYQAVELEEEGFNVYFEGGLRNDDNFNAQDYWLSISREDNLGLSRSHTSTIRDLILRVIHKMITYGLCQRTTGYEKIQKNYLYLLSMFDARHQNRYANVSWVITKWMKRKRARTQKESQICCGQFISKLARKCRVLTGDVVRSLSAPIYCRDLDTITLRDLIDSKGKLIPEDPQPDGDTSGCDRADGV
ncbi:hypothetical protein Tco_1033969 [Tanacetum coccineum]